MAARSLAVVVGVLLVLGGCGGSEDLLPAAGPESLNSGGNATPSASAPPSPAPSVAETRLSIAGERVTEPHTFRVTREVDAQGHSVRHRLVIQIPDRGWDVRVSLPSASFSSQSRDRDGHITEERLAQPEREPWHWCMSASCTGPDRPVIERFAVDGIEYGTEGLPSQGAADPCANGTWQHGDPPRAENRQGSVTGVTERLTPTAEGSLYFWGRDDQCRANAPYPGVAVDFMAPVE